MAANHLSIITFGT